MLEVTRAFVGGSVNRAKVSSPLKSLGLLTPAECETRLRRRALTARIWCHRRGRRLEDLSIRVSMTLSDVLKRVCTYPEGWYRGSKFLLLLVGTFWLSSLCSFLPGVTLVRLALLRCLGLQVVSLRSKVIRLLHAYHVGLFWLNWSNDVRRALDGD